MRWRTKTRSDMHSRSFVRVTPQLGSSYQSQENSLRWLPKVAAFNLVNIVCRVDMYVHQWYINPYQSSCFFLITRLKCHTDQDNHRRMKCNQRCLRLACRRAHPCSRLCSEDCGDCQFPIYDVKLPCGHIADSVPW